MLSAAEPVVLNAEFEAMREYMGETAARIDCTFDADGRAGRHAPGASTASAREAEDGGARAAACTSS